MKLSNNMKNKIPLDTYWRVELVCTKFRTESPLEPQLQYNNDQIPLKYQDSLWSFLTTLEVKEICSFRLVLEEKTRKDIPKPSRSEFLEKFSANNFTLSDAEDNISWPLNRGGIAYLTLLKRLLAFLLNSPEPSFKNTSVRKNKHFQKSRTVRIKVWDPTR